MIMIMNYWFYFLEFLFFILIMILGCKGRIFFIVVYFVYLLILLECVNIFIIDEIYDLIKGLLDYENLSKLLYFFVI